MSVSVVLCTYNGARFLAEQVNSILNQTYSIQELIISDDASTDNTIILAREMAARDARIRVVSLQENVGFSANFQQAITQAIAPLIALADQDDIWHPEKIARMLAAFETDASLIYCDSVKFADTPPVSPKPSPKNRRIAGSDPKKIAVYNTVSGHAMIIRKSLCTAAFPLPEGVYYDWWLAIVAMATNRVQFLPEVLVYQRVHDRNVTLQSNLSESTHRQRFRSTLVKHLDAFRKIATLSDGDRLFFEEGYAYWQLSLYQRFNFGLFRWLMRNRENIFCNKVRKFPLISQLKNSWLLSFRWRV
ncbi:MAG: glycosyltransferase [Bacteroidetes bacterium]|nr:glycosyltransferase [Bacteroidota bacterium]